LEDHHEAKLLQKCTKEGRINIEQPVLMIALLAAACSEFCKNRAGFIITVSVFVYGITELRQQNRMQSLQMALLLLAQI
jgi:hypothetical protein